MIEKTIPGGNTMDLSVFLAALNALAPVILLILLGYVLKQRGFLSEVFLKNGNWLVFYICFPAMLFINVYDMDGFGSINWPFVLYCTGAVLVIFVVGLFAAVAATPVPNRRGVIWQASFRSNFIILGMSIAAALGGGEAAALVAVTASFIIPLFNVLAVIALTVFTQGAHGAAPTPGRVLVDTLRNPHVVSVVVGMVCLALREAQRAVFGEVVFSIRVHLEFLYTLLKNITSITTPFALLVLGGQFVFSAAGGLLREIAAATVCRILISPVLGIGGAWLLSRAGYLSCGGNEYITLIALFAAPAAVASAIMATEMGGDEQLATQIVVWSSLLSVFTFFAEVVLLMQLGLLAVL